MIILAYICVCLLTVSVISTWQYTTIKIHICEFFFKDSMYKEIVDINDWENYMLLKQGKLGELLSCKICLSHWVALLFSLIVLYLSDLSFVWWFPIFCFLTVPFFVRKFV